MPSVTSFNTSKADQYKQVEFSDQQKSSNLGELWVKEVGGQPVKAVGFADMAAPADNGKSTKTISWGDLRSQNEAKDIAFDIKVKVRLGDTRSTMTMRSGGQQQQFVLPTKAEAGLSSEDGAIELEFKLAEGSTVDKPVWVMKDARKHPDHAKEARLNNAAENATFKQEFSKLNGGDGTLKDNGAIASAQVRQGTVTKGVDAEENEKPQNKDRAAPQPAAPQPATPVERKGLAGGNNRCYLNALFQWLYRTPLIGRLQSEAAKLKDANGEYNKEARGFVKAFRELVTSYKDKASSIPSTADLAHALDAFGVLPKDSNGSMLDSGGILSGILGKFGSQGNYGLSHPKISEDNSDENKALLQKPLVAIIPNKNEDDVEALLQQKAASLELKEHLLLSVIRPEAGMHEMLAPEHITLKGQAYALKSFVQHVSQDAKQPGKQNSPESRNHYVTYAKEGDDWYMFDDSVVQRVEDIGAVLAGAADNIALIHYQAETVQK